MSYLDEHGFMKPNSLLKLCAVSCLVLTVLNFGLYAVIANVATSMDCNFLPEKLAETHKHIHATCRNADAISWSLTTIEVILAIFGIVAFFFLWSHAGHISKGIAEKNTPLYVEQFLQENGHLLVKEVLNSGVIVAELQARLAVFGIENAAKGPIFKEDWDEDIPENEDASNSEEVDGNES